MTTSKAKPIEPFFKPPNQDKEKQFLKGKTA
jgi:hypothetical protein